MTETKVYQALSALGIDVYPISAPRDASYPFATYFVVSERKKQDIGAGIYAQVQRYQLDIWAKSYAQAKEIKEQAIEKLVELDATQISAQDLFEKEIEVYRELIQFYIKE